jgi:hypothetical protein
MRLKFFDLARPEIGTGTDLPQGLKPRVCDIKVKRFSKATRLDQPQFRVTTGRSVATYGVDDQGPLHGRLTIDQMQLS